MRVLHIISTLATGGAEKLILETVPLLNKRGIQTDVLVLKGGDEPFYRQLKELNCCNLYSLGYGSVYNPLQIFRIIPYLKKYDLVHSHLFSAQYFVALAKLVSLSKTPIVFTEHSTSNRRFANRVFRIVDSFIYRIYSKIVAITNEVKEAVLKQTGILTEKIVVIKNGIDTGKFVLAEKVSRSSICPSLLENDFLVMQVSSFQYPKDQATVIKSMLRLPFNVKLLLVGDGIERVKSEELVKQLSLMDRVYFLGIRNDIPSLLKTMNVLVLSSRYEGLSLSSIEGMASGRPFIASDVPGLSEVVGGAGVLFPAGDYKKLAEEILKLKENPVYYNDVAKKCQKRAAEFDIDKMVAKHMELYKEILAEKH